METILGLDLGTTSVGFALIRFDEARANGEILRMGVRIFPEGVTEKDREPRNKARRQARLVRRQVRRRRQRRKAIGETLAGAGLLPPFSQDPASDWQRLMGSTQVKNGTEGTRCDPYALRRRGLTERLEPWQVGRALYHIAKRRGFAGRQVAAVEAGDEKPRKDDAQAKEDEGTNAQIAELAGKLDGKTVGAYLAALPENERKRGRHRGRDMMEAEFDQLWTVQAEHHPVMRAAEFHETIKGLAFFQRPVFWRRGTIGKCALEPGNALALKGSWQGQRFIMLQQLNSLRFAHGNKRPLDAGERAAILSQLEGQVSMTFGAVRKALKAYWKATERAFESEPTFNFEIGGKKSILGNAIESQLCKALGDAWEVHANRDRIRAEVAERLWATAYHARGDRIEIRGSSDADAERIAFCAKARTDWGVTAEQAVKLAAVKLVPGWLRHSDLAIGKLLPRMEAGALYSEAMQEEYGDYWQRQGKGADKLPSKQADMPDIRNPTVTRALNEVRKVVNNLIRAHGKPDLIRIELARDLKLSPRERSDVESTIRKNERRRDDARKALTEAGIAPRGRDIEKWLLWQECGESCVYTGRRINFDDLFRNGTFDVEHIFPLSRSLDNGYGNKTLCEKALNIAKGPRAPFEHFRGEAWDDFTSRVSKSALQSNAPAKARRLLAEAFREVGSGGELSEDFAERQLRDTAYIARVARDFLLRLYAPSPGRADPVESCVGKVTAQLRRMWGLHTILEEIASGGVSAAAEASAAQPTGPKRRDDHRHHAVDALTVALATRAMVKRLSDWHGAKERGEQPHFPLPWPSLRQDALRATAAIVVSHRVRRKLSGPLHEQTTLGLTDDTPSKGAEPGTRIFAKRKPLAEVTVSEIDEIRDLPIRTAVKREIWKAAGKPVPEFDCTKTVKQLVKDKVVTDAVVKATLKRGIRIADRTNPDGRPVQRVRLSVERADDAVLRLPGHRGAYAEKGKVLHHVALYERAGHVEYRAVDRIEMVRRSRQRLPLVAHELEGGWRLVLILHPSDMIEQITEDGEVVYQLVRKFNSAGRIFYKPHWMTREPKPEVSFGPDFFLKGKVRKVVVDPIGRVSAAHD